MKRRPPRPGGKRSPRGRGRDGSRAAPLARRVLRVLGKPERPALTPRALARELRGADIDARTLRRTLETLEREGRVERTEGGGYRLVSPEGWIEAVWDGRAGADDTSGRHWDLGAQPAGGEALRPGERIWIVPIGDPSQARAALVDMVAPRRAEWLGLFERAREGGVIGPYRDDAWWELEVREADTGGARHGEVVTAELLERARSERPRRTRARAPAEERGRARLGRAAVSERLGRPGDPDADFRAIVWRHRLPVAFPEAVRLEAQAASAAITDEERTARRDLRDLDFVTIDPLSARDHDDAVCVEPGRAGGYRLWVAIADVAHYVPAGSALDREALRRGNSVYFPDRAIPMLPERLSSELCSLRPDEDRLAWAVELEISADGKLGRRRFHRALVRSRARLDYDRAARVMEGRSEDDEVEASLHVPLQQLASVARALMERRFACGSLDFDLPTAEIVLDDEGRPLGISETPRTVAHRAIEEAMLAANRAVAEALVAAGRPAVHRIHEAPGEAELGELRELLESFGLLRRARGEAAALTTRELSAALARAEGSPAERVVHMASLRAMRQARYSAHSRGHYALGFEAYLHFTSPIRRYADLVVHRALEAHTAGQPLREPERALEDLQRVASWISRRERVAMDAEREMVDLKKCLLMRRHVGEVFTGRIASVAPHGLYVRLDDPAVDGLVPMAVLPGRWELDERRHALVAPRSGARLELGDRVRVRLDRVDIVRGWITLALLEHEEGEHPKSRRARPPARRTRPR